MDAGVPTVFGSDGPRATRVVRPRGGFIVLALSKCVPDGMDGRKIQNVKPHSSNVGKPRLGIAQRSVAARCGCARPWEQFVPGRKASLFAVDYDGELLRIPRSESAIRVLFEELSKRFSENCLLAALWAALAQ